MSARKKSLVLIICLMAAALLTACQTHVDSDPWPASDGATATQAPTDAPADGAQDASVETQPTEVPEPSGEPGLNG